MRLSTVAHSEHVGRNATAAQLVIALSHRKLGDSASRAIDSLLSPSEWTFYRVTASQANEKDSL